MKRTMIHVVGLAGLALLLTLVYLLVDQSVTIHYYGTEISHQRNVIDLLASLMVRYPRDGGIEDVFHILQAGYPDHVVKLVADTIEIDGIALVFRDNVLIRVDPF